MINLSEIRKDLTPEEFRVLYELSLAEKNVTKDEILSAIKMNSRQLGETLCGLVEKGYIIRTRTRINGKFSKGVFYYIIEDACECKSPVHSISNHSAEKPQCGEKKEKVRQKERNLHLCAHACEDIDVYKITLEAQNDLIAMAKTFLFAPSMIKICDIESELANFSPKLANAIRDFIAYRRSILTKGSKLSQKSLFNIFENIENAKKANFSDESIIENIYTAISNKWIMPFVDKKMSNFLKFMKQRRQTQTQTQDTSYTQKELAQMVEYQHEGFFSSNSSGVVTTEAYTPCGKRIIVDFDQKKIIAR